MKGYITASVILGAAAVFSSLIISGNISFKDEHIIQLSGGAIKLGDVYKENKNLDEFHLHESTKVDIAHNPGPLKNFIDRISHIQKLENDYKLENPNYEPMVRVSIVTARNAPSHKRAINTMREWGILANEAFFMGGVDKSKVLEILKPHIFFDDQMTHLKSSGVLPSVHIPFGIANKVVHNES